MSQIFDALQRSEAERNGKNPATTRHAIDLLQSTETYATANRAAASESHDSWNTTVDSLTGTAATESRREPEVAVAADLPGATAVAVEERSEGPMQCEVLNISVSAESHLVALPEAESPASEAFHLLGVRLRHLRRQRPLKKVLVTSTIPQEGKSVVAANLACTLALHTQQGTAARGRRPAADAVEDFRSCAQAGHLRVA